MATETGILSYSRDRMTKKANPACWELDLVGTKVGKERREE